jgi:hypothetical protein
MPSETCADLLQVGIPPVNQNLAYGTAIFINLPALHFHLLAEHGIRKMLF